MDAGRPEREDRGERPAQCATTPRRRRREDSQQTRGGLDSKGAVLFLVSTSAFVFPIPDRVQQLAIDILAF